MVPKSTPKKRVQKNQSKLANLPRKGKRKCNQNGRASGHTPSQTSIKIPGTATGLPLTSLPLYPCGSALRTSWTSSLTSRRFWSTASLLTRCLPTEKRGQPLLSQAGSLDFFPCFNEGFFPEGKWATLGARAIPRQPVAGTRQASFPQPSSKNRFDIWAAQWAAYQILSW